VKVARSISVVIPVFNAEASLGPLAARLESVLAAGSEVVLVDDASHDRSWAEIEKIVRDRPNWRGVQLGRNSGQHAALLVGIRMATCEIVVTMDDDLQHRPEDVHLLVDALGDDVDLVYGATVQEEHGVVRSVLSRVVKRTLRAALGVAHAESTGAFRCFRRDLRDAFEHVNDAYVSIDVLLSWATSRMSAVDVEMEQRAAGRSGYTFRRLVRHTFNMVTGYSAAPLRLVAYVGTALGVLGLGSLTYVLVRFFIGESSVPGFTFLASLLSLVGGIQMIAIAVIGEYLGRVHFRTLGRPPYYVRRTIGGTE
jgi:glycosyltransferase involved in cell wall biosynthesis